MLESIEDYLRAKNKKNESSIATSSDTKIAIERWLQDSIKTDSVYCVDVSGSAVTVRVGSPVVYQEVCLREYDLREAIERLIGYTMKEITIITSY